MQSRNRGPKGEGVTELVGCPLSDPKVHLLNLIAGITEGHFSAHYRGKLIKLKLMGQFDINI
jgi:hypothetical protein